MSCGQVMFQHIPAIQDPGTAANKTPANETVFAGNHSSSTPVQFTRPRCEESGCYSPHCYLQGSTSNSALNINDLAVGSRAQYVSANCVVVTHYVGDAAAEVDEHFSRALSRLNQAHPSTSSFCTSSTSSVTSQENAAEDFATHGWRAMFPASYWTGDYQVSGRSTSPCGSPLDLASPRGPGNPPQAYSQVSYPEPWALTQQQTTSNVPGQGYHFSVTPAVAGLEATEGSHRDIFWY